MNYKESIEQFNKRFALSSEDYKLMEKRRVFGGKEQIPKIENFIKLHTIALIKVEVERLEEWLKDFKKWSGKYFYHPEKSERYNIGYNKAIQETIDYLKSFIKEIE